MNYAEFQTLLAMRGEEFYRDMPWRRDTRAYYILVSELMLQQTQVARVVPKFEAFTRQFPNIEALAAASLAEVLKLWVGLGYNRRAKYLHMAAQKIVAEHRGEIPADFEALKRLPGIGSGTAGAIMTYAFNQPVVFIETNVRTVYFHYFFEPDEKVADSQLIPLIEATIDKENPRGFYWAVMDYGSWLKQNTKRGTSQSLHYKKQSKFKGSVREIRGGIVRALAVRDMTPSELRRVLMADDRFAVALEGLIGDELVIRSGSKLHLTK